VSVQYRAVGWNRQKRIYDGVIAAAVATYLVAFVGLGVVLRPQATAETLVIRALGTAALLGLHVVLSIGPLSRLDRRFLPLLYNRRHLGVTTFLLGLGHGSFALFQFHALGDTSPFVSLLVSNRRLDSLGQFPFELLGLGALVILFLLAATSHDFWLASLSAPTWKRLHMAVYLAYGLLVMHVATGVLQAETSPVLVAALGLGVVWLSALHLLAARREHGADAERGAAPDGLVDVCAWRDIPDGRARVVTVAGERVAVFRYQGRVAALSNVCQHQNGPLGEGRIVAGCVTCPWHGYQYCPESGRSPEPYTERVPTFRVTVRRGRVLVDPRPLAPGTRVEPARIEEPVGAKA
jgi:nitrite reductase/ring-hydroxylating ferredoxin subunit/DMSO/TMAO reductase YedYZ heme-binding membrane subunit